MLIGAHTLIYSSDPARLRAFFRETLGLASVDAGRGWLIFALPPGELAVHPTDETDGSGPRHELYLMCDDLTATMTELAARGVTFARPVVEAGFGRMTAISLPDGGELGLYEPRHPTALGLSGEGR